MIRRLLRGQLGSGVLAVRPALPRLGVRDMGMFASRSLLAAARAAPSRLGSLVPIVVAASAQQCVLFAPTNDEAAVFASTDAAGIRRWIAARAAGGKRATLLPVDALVPGCATDALRSEFGVGNESAWTIAHAMLSHHARTIAGFRAPTSLEDAYHMIHHKVFEGGDSVRVTVVAANAAEGAVPSVRSDGPLRDAVLAWDTVVELHKRFGLPGMKKPLPPVEQVLQRLVRIVNIFPVRLNSRVGVHAKMADAAKGKYELEVFNVGKGATTSITFDSFEATRVKTLIETLFVPSTLTVFVPTSDTQESTLLNFVRHCGPRCPFFVCRPGDVGAAAASAAATPQAMWVEMAAHLGSEEAVIAATEKWANAKAAARATKPRTVPQQRGERERLSAAAMAAVTAANNNSGSAASTGGRSTIASPSSFISGAQSDPEVFLMLQQWKQTIYENNARKHREESAAKLVERFLVIDLETTTTKRYKRIANPFTNENYIVLPGLLDYRGKMTIPPEHQTRDDPYRLPPLDDYDCIVGHNLKFDLLHLWRDPKLRRFLRRGGRIWDTMYAEYLLSGHHVKLGVGAGLEDVARSRGGKLPKLDEVKAAWAQGKQTFEIPHATLKTYLEGDLKNTEMIFRQQVQEAVNQRQVVIINARMDGLLCTTEMEFNGLKIDLSVSERQKAGLDAEIAELTKSMDDFLPDVIPPHLRSRFNWQSNKDLGALFFGGSVTYDTHAREAKKIPTRPFARQELAFGDQSLTMMSPPMNPTVAAHCTIVSGQLMADKSTKLHAMYYAPTLQRLAFRSSAGLDELAQVKVQVGDAPERLPFAVALQFTVVPVFMAVDVDTESGRIKAITLRGVMDSGSETSMTAVEGDAAACAALDHFFSQQVKRHTRAVSSGDSRIPPVVPSVLLLCRDAAFDVGPKLLQLPTLGPFFERHLTAASLQREEDAPYTVQLVDSSALLEFTHRVTTTAAVAATGAAASDKAAAKKRQKKKANADVKLGSSFALSADAFKEEALMPASKWLDRAAPRLLSAARTLYALDIAESTSADAAANAAKKLTKKQKEKASMKLDPAAAGLAADAGVGIRHLTAKLSELQDRLGLSDSDMARLMLMRLAGKAAATVLDPFALGSNEAKEATFHFPGLINELGLGDAEKMTALEKFRSPLTRQPAVNDEALKFFRAKGVAVSVQLHKLRKMTKLMGTYFEDTGTGMASLVHETDSCIHHELIHNKTNTGRLASANPNCQNLPKEDKSDLREMFVSRFAGGKCIEADYSQLEVITLCALANDKQMIADLESKVDFHCKRVTMMRPDLTYDEVLQRAKINKEPEFVKLRQQAKIFSFQRQYGAGVKTISESTGLHPDEVRKLMENERCVYADIDRFTQLVTLSAQQFDKNLQDGARNAMGDIKFKGMFPVVTGSRYVFTEHDVPTQMLKPGSKSTAFSPTHIKNYPVQGFAGEIVQIMLGRLWRHFLATSNYGGAALLTNTVHDCVWIDAKDDIVKQVAADTGRIMSSAREVLNEMWPEMQCRVQFPVDVVVGPNMCHMNPLPK